MSAIPRLSKLPVPASQSQPDQIPSPGTVEPRRGPQQLPRPNGSAMQPPKTRPMSFMPERHAKQASQSSDEGSNGSAYGKVRTPRQLSQEENWFELANSPESSEVSPDASLSDPQSPLQPRRRPRPSLSDRTAESIAHIPASPGYNKRSSSFFNPQSPMTPHNRPVSIMGATTLPRPGYSSVRGTRGNSVDRPSSPTKTASGLPTPRQPTTAAKPKSSLPGPPSSFKGLPTPAKAPAQNSVRPPSAGATNRSVNGVHARSQTVAARSGATHSAGKASLSGIFQPRRATSATQTQPAQSRTALSVQTDLSNTENAKQAKSSAALRAQIAQARAAHRNQNRNEALDALNGASPVAYDFEECSDPFNLKPKDEEPPLQRKLDDARKDGKLNVSGMSLKTIPVEILTMYDAEAMEASSVSWSETVDLTRFNAADNGIETIGDEVFPDVSKEDLALSKDSRGNQFGGIEVLDLHSNLLKKIPPGLRHLEKLTTLNISRNRLDNWCFEIVTSISSLRSLDLSNNELARELPSSIGQLVNLESLDLHGNKLSLLPPSLRSLGKLRTLNLSSNRLSQLPLDTLATLPQLQHLHAAANALTGALFPTNISSFPRLQTLDVANNSIALLSFGPQPLQLPALSHLDVSANQLAMLDVSGWTSLATLLVADNALGPELPAGIVGLTQNLKAINLSNNSLREIDPHLCKMQGLLSIALEGNPLRPGDRRFLAMDIETTKRELAKRLGDDTDDRPQQQTGRSAPEHVAIGGKRTLVIGSMEDDSF